MGSKNLSPSSGRLSAWQAELQLRADRTSGRSRVRRLRALGPLQMQKVLYPEGDGIAHVFILHPPSGIAQDDHLRIEITADDASHSVYTTPGATRWYKALPDAKQPAQQHVVLDLRNQSVVEWLPYENLYFDQAWAYNSLEIRLEDGCRALGWDLHQFGRTSCGEPWQSGRAQTTLSLYVCDQLVWTESAQWDSSHLMMQDDHHQLAGYSITGSLWAFGPAMSTQDFEALAASLPANPSCMAAVSQLPVTCPSPHGHSDPQALVIMRLLSNDPEQARSVCEQTRAFLRPLMMSAPAADLRIWAT